MHPKSSTQGVNNSLSTYVHDLNHDCQSSMQEPVTKPRFQHGLHWLPTPPKT